MTSRVTTKSRGDEGEERALQHLLAQGLTLVERNYRVARGPSARGAEVDLIMRDRDGTLVFVEVRQRKSTTQGGAAASVSRTKQQRCIRGAQHYLMALAVVIPLTGFLAERVGMKRLYIITLVQGASPPESIMPGIERFAGIVGGLAILLIVSLLIWPTDEERADAS